MNYNGEKFPGKVTGIDNSDAEVSCIEVQIFENGQHLKMKSSTYEIKLYMSLSRQQLQATEDSLHLSITLHP